MFHSPGRFWSVFHLSLPEGVTETRNLIQDLPDYSEDLLKMVCSLLKTYRETCQAAYRGIVQPETEDKRIYSVAWLKDDDITRFLKYDSGEPIVSERCDDKIFPPFF